MTMTEEEMDQFAGEAATKALIREAGPQKTGILDTFVKPAILPTALGAAGTAAGTAMGGPLGGVVGSGIGSGIGEAANQALGVTEPSMGNIALAAGVPMAIGGAAALLKSVSPFMGAGRAAQRLNALAPEEAAAKIAQLAPPIPSSALFKQATEQHVAIPMNRTLHVLDDLLDDLTNVSKGVQSANRQVITYLQGLKDKLITNPHGLDPLSLQRELEGAGNVVKSVGARGGTGSGAIKTAFKEMVKDLDDAAKLANPAAPAAATLKAARDTFKKESVLKELGDYIDDAIKPLRGQGSNVQFNAAAVLRDIGKNPFYKDALSATERSDIEGLLKLLNKIPALKPGAGQQFGFGRGGQMLLAGGGGYGLAAMAGGGEEAILGAAVGAAVPPLAEFGRNVATAMQMQTGRALMKELLTQSKGIATPQVASVLAAYAAAVRAGQVQQ